MSNDYRALARECGLAAETIVNSASPGKPLSLSDRDGLVMLLRRAEKALIEAHADERYNRIQIDKMKAQA